MPKMLYGAPVAEEICKSVRVGASKVAAEAGREPMLALVRVGDSSDDSAYIRSISRLASDCHVSVVERAFSLQAASEELLSALQELSRDDGIDGIMLLRPIPSSMYDDVIRDALPMGKDVDGMGADALADVFISSGSAYPPATAEACIRILDHYGIGVSGKRAVVIGRSLVIGKPVGMMMLERDATVTFCHSKTEDLMATTNEADIIVSAIGRARALDARYFKEGQIVLDVGMNVDDQGKLAGDVDFNDACNSIGEEGAITPVPKGVGSVTTAVLLDHLVRAAKASFAIA